MSIYGTHIEFEKIHQISKMSKPWLLGGLAGASAVGAGLGFWRGGKTPFTKSDKELFIKKHPKLKGLSNSELSKKYKTSQALHGAKSGAGLGLLAPIIAVASKKIGKSKVEKIIKEADNYASNMVQAHHNGMHVFQARNSFSTHPTHGSSKLFERVFKHHFDNAVLNSDVVSGLAQAKKFMGASNVSTKKELKELYRELSKKMHPDKGGNVSDMRALNESFETIKNSPFYEKLASSDYFKNQIAVRKALAENKKGDYQVSGLGQHADAMAHIDLYRGGGAIGLGLLGAYAGHKLSPKIVAALKKTKKGKDLFNIMEAQFRAPTRYGIFETKTSPEEAEQLIKKFHSIVGKVSVGVPAAVAGGLAGSYEGKRTYLKKKGIKYKPLGLGTTITSKAKEKYLDELVKKANIGNYFAETLSNASKARIVAGGLVGGIAGGTAAVKFNDHGNINTDAIKSNALMFKKSPEKVKKDIILARKILAGIIGSLGGAAVGAGLAGKSPITKAMKAHPEFGPRLKEINLPSRGDEAWDYLEKNWKNRYKDYKPDYARNARNKLKQITSK